MRFEPLLNTTLGFGGEAQVSAYAAHAKLAVMMNPSHCDALSVAPPIDARITTTLARHLPSGKLDRKSVV